MVHEELALIRSRSRDTSTHIDKVEINEKDFSNKVFIDILITN